MSVLLCLPSVALLSSVLFPFFFFLSRSLASRWYSLSLLHIETALSVWGSCTPNSEW